MRAVSTVQDMRAGDGRQCSVRFWREGHELADEGACVGVAFEDCHRTTKLGCLGEEGGDCRDAVCLYPN